MQKCKFFMENMRVTQGYGIRNNGSIDYTSYSHTGSYALDLGGKDASAIGDWAYAPCDVVVKRIYGKYNAVWFESLEQVECADGKARKLIFLLLHINSADLTSLGIKVGKVFRQGEKFYREGVAGATGNHIHIEVGEAPFIGTGWVQTANKDRTGAYVWKINRQLKPHDVFYIGNDVNIINDGGYEWTIENNVKWLETNKCLEVISDRCEFFNSPDINNVAGKLPDGTIYEITGISEKPINNFIWVKFQKTDGEYYAVILEDRSRLVNAPTDNDIEIEKLTAELAVANKALAEEKEINAHLIADNKRLLDMVNKVREAVK